jgi:hypothetical protein
MSIAFWITLWKITFILGILVFIGMAIWVTIIGFKDIKILLSNKKKEGN